jgi:formylglycine-generating enzyme required for sulfatase activity
VGAYSAYANAYGLYDMHGNVFEWCLDQWDFSDNYAGLPATDPVCTTGPNRVLRGGYWISNAQSCRSAYRGASDPATPTTTSASA